MDQDNLNRIFKMDKSFNSIFILGLIFFGGGLLISIVLPFFLPVLIEELWWMWIPVIVGYIIFTKMFLEAWYSRKNYIKLNDYSISLHSPDRQIGVLKWTEIEKIEENSVFERLILYGPFKKKLNLEYQMENISELFSIIFLKVPQLTNRYSKLREFRRTNHIHIFYGIIFLATVSFAILCVIIKMWFGVIFIGFFSGLIAYLLLTEFIAICLIRDEIVIQYLFRKKIYSLNQLNEIYLKVLTFGQGKSSPYVILKMNSGKTIKLNMIREGTIALYAAVNNFKCQSS